MFQNLLVAIFFLMVAEISFLEAVKGSIYEKESMNCLSVKSKYKPFEALDKTIWRNPLQKVFTDQEIEITRCKNEGEACFDGIFSIGSNVRAICKTQTINMTIKMYRSDIVGNISQNIKNIPIGCGCHFESSPLLTF